MLVLQTTDDCVQRNEKEKSIAIYTCSRTIFEFSFVSFGFILILSFASSYMQNFHNYIKNARNTFVFNATSLAKCYVYETIVWLQLKMH